MEKLKKVCWLITLSLTFVSCSQPDKKTQPKTLHPKITLPTPFKKHLKLELGPEIIFDVFSWGRGTDSSSSVLVLRSDSLKNEFSVASTDNLNGHLQEVFNTDMDNDSHPEIVIYYTKNDKYGTADVLCYEFTGKAVDKISFPNLSSKTEKQYRGHDKFYVKGGNLYREFDLYADVDSNRKPTDKKTLKYFLVKNKFDLNEL